MTAPAVQQHSGGDGVRLLRPPRLRTDDSGHRSASWLELFFDLVFVVAVAQLATTFAEHATLTGYAQFLLVFIPVWWAWVGYTVYADRFDTDDVIFRLLMGAGMLAVGLISIAIPTAFEAGSLALPLGYALNRLVLIMLNLRAVLHVPAARSLVTVSCGAYSAGTVIWLGSLALPPSLRPAAWLTAIVLEGIVPWVFRRAMTAVPTHATHLPERFGLFTIIVLGESLVAVTLGLAHTPWTRMTAATAVGGFLLAFALWWLYFDSVAGARIRQGLRARNIFIYAHLPIAVGLVSAAVGIEKGISGTAGPHSATPGVLIGVGLAAVLLSSALLARFAITQHRRHQHLVLGGVALLVLAAAAPALTSSAATLIAVTLLAISVASDAVARRREAVLY